MHCWRCTTTTVIRSREGKHALEIMDPLRAGEALHVASLSDLNAQKAQTCSRIYSRSSLRNTSRSCGVGITAPVSLMRRAPESNFMFLSAG